ncbi:MAG: von Willebrand factor type A domain-containing protein [Chitinophagaceae bacterium]|nr:von Willebrand factor type A domain-containing protein [Chitinophagaceae bacterium]
MKQVLSAVLLLVMTTGFRQATRAISGRVSDEYGYPITGASVVIKGSRAGTTTHANGEFRLTIDPKKNVVLQVSALGFETKEIKVGRDNFYRIKLASSQKALSEVVVTGYGSPGKKDVTGVYTYDNGKVNPQSLTAGIQQMSVGRVGGVRIGGFADGQRIRTDAEMFDREGYDHITENAFAKVADHPLSTFSIDVDAASYSNVRRMLKQGILPQDGAVRIEEMINYFSYQYPQPVNKGPLAAHMELGACPWNPQHQLVLIGLQGRKIDVADLPPSNLTFLVDVSGSMMTADKLPLVQQSLKLLVDQLRPSDRVSLVVYAGSAGLVLPPTSGDQKTRIKEAIDNLEAGGSTAGGQGIQLAYKTAREHFIKEGNNRVILCTDGDFNVGQSSDDALERLIEEERKSGVFLTVLGFGTGNYQDAKMQKLADKGNGNHAYIDQLSEAKKVLISEFGGTLFTIAKDVKLQVEFNPARVKAYRLIGYENRLLNKEDFNNDRKDAGDLGSAHTVTALYELVPPGAPMPEIGEVDSLRYQMPLTFITTSQEKLATEILQVKLRYKQPDSEQSSLLVFPLKGQVKKIEQLSDNFRFSAAVAAFGMLLRHSEFKGNASFNSITVLARDAVGEDREGYRKEFLELVRKAGEISGREVTYRE